MIGGRNLREEQEVTTGRERTTSAASSYTYSRGWRVDNSSDNDKKRHFYTASVFVSRGVIVLNGVVAVSMKNKTKSKFWKRLKFQITSTSVSWQPQQSECGSKEAEKRLE